MCILFYASLWYWETEEMSNYQNFTITCNRCKSKDVTLSIQMFDSCDIRTIECNKCHSEENF